MGGPGGICCFALAHYLFQAHPFLPGTSLVHCCRGNPEITGINRISGAERVSSLRRCGICAWGADLPISMEPCRDIEIALNEHSHELVFIPKCDTVIYICQYFTELPCSLWMLSSKMFQAMQLQYSFAKMPF